MSCASCVRGGGVHRRGARRWTRTVPLVCVAVLMVAGCSGVDGSAGEEVPSAAPTVEFLESREEGESGADDPGEGAGPEEPQVRGSDPDCIVGVYDSADHHLQGWYDLMFAATGADIEFEILPGSGGAMSFAGNGDYELALVIEANVVPPSDTPLGDGWYSGNGVATGRWDADEVHLDIRRESIDMTGTISIGGVEVQVPDPGELGISEAAPVTSLAYECRENGLLSVYFPTGVDGVTKLLDLIRR